MLGVFLDTETNGLDWSMHSILEIAFIIINLNSGKELARYNSLSKITDEQWSKSDKDSLAYTKITRKEVDSLGKTQNTISDEILTLFKEHGIYRDKAVFICQNPGFDRSFFRSLVDVATQERLKLPYYWLDLASMYWVRRMDKTSSHKFSISKDAIAEHYGLPGEKKPHRAMQGVEHLIECYHAVLRKDSQ